MGEEGQAPHAVIRIRLHDDAVAAACSVQRCAGGRAPETLTRIGKDGSTAGASELCARAAKAIGKLSKGNPRKGGGRLRKWDKAKITRRGSDPSGQQKALAMLDEAGAELFDDAIWRPADGTAARRRYAYKVVLEQRYGVTIETSVGDVTPDERAARCGTCR